MTNGRLCTGLGVGSVLLGLCAFPAQAQKTWAGDSEEWNDILHWVPNGVPGPNDDVVHTWTQGVHGILMDVPAPGGSARYEVQEFRLDPDWANATEQGSLKLRGYECFEEFPPPCSDFSRLQFVGGMDGSGTAQDPLDPNLYKIQLGPTDIVMVGEATLDRQPGGVIENTTHFEWELGGENAGNPPTAWISGEIGPGKWSVDQGIVHVGFATNFDNIIDIIEASPGKVDSQVTSPIYNYLDPGYDGASMWRIDGMTLWSKQLRNLDYWRVRRDNGEQNGIGAQEYMEIRSMTFEEEPFDGDVNLPTNLKAASVATDPREERGMRIIQLLEMWSHDPANVIGPNALAEELIVERDDDLGSPEAILSIRHGVLFDVSQDEPGAVTNPEFRNASSLRYGPPSGLPRLPYPWESLNRTTFTVENPEGASPPPVLLFRDDSYITTLDPDAIVPGENDLLIQSFRTSIDIEATVSEMPARDWYTGDTDLFVRKSSEIELEAIAEDNCNAWFEDVPEPRCQKYWRNLHLRAALLTLVDDDDNHVCGPQPPAPMDGAMYVLEDIGTDGTGPSTLDLINGISVYYGGVLDPFNEPMNFPNGTPIPFKKTIYGDFDGNCSVTGNDVTILSDFLGSGGSRCDWPVADWNGDCVVNIVDLTEVMNRASGFYPPSPNCHPMEAFTCFEGEFLDAGSGGGGGDGPGEGGDGGGAPASAEEAEAFSIAVVEFIATQNPVDEDETQEVTEAVRALGRTATAVLSVEALADLADALDGSRDTYRNATTRRLAGELAATLRN